MSRDFHREMIESLTADVERLTRERDEARDYAIKKSDEAHTIELELHARAEALHQGHPQG